MMVREEKNNSNGATVKNYFLKREIGSEIEIYLGACRVYGEGQKVLSMPKQGEHQR